MSLQNITYFDDELDIRSSKLAHLISYPRYVEEEYNDRVKEMECLGITSIVLGGRTILNGTRIAGKGCVGIVLKAKAGTKVCGLKVRRIDADRNDMDNESRLHKMANSAGVGPEFMGHTKNLIAMEFVTGQSITEWIKSENNNNNNNKENNDTNDWNNRSTKKSKISNVARAILEQCFRLDVAGLDHGELSRLARHVIVTDNGPYIIDFESASTTRKTCNVTAATQSIFLHGTVASKMGKFSGNIDREKVINALRTYKSCHTRANFDVVLDSLLIT